MDKLNELMKMQTGLVKRVIENNGHEDYTKYIERINELSDPNDMLSSEEAKEKKELEVKLSKWINQELACIASESDEIRRTTIWKHWKKQQEFNLKECKDEVVDLLHFTLELFILLGMDAEEVFKSYCMKNGINHERQDQGY